MTDFIDIKLADLLRGRQEVRRSANFTVPIPRTVRIWIRDQHRGTSTMSGPQMSLRPKEVPRTFMPLIGLLCQWVVVLGVACFLSERKLRATTVEEGFLS